MFEGRGPRDVYARGGDMLNCIVVGPNRSLARALHALCAEFEDLFVYKILDAFPSLFELARLLNLFGTEVIFLEIDSSERAFAVAREIRGLHPQTVVVGFADKCEPEQAAEAARSGITEILVSPFEPGTLQKLVVKAFESRSPGTSQNVLAFLPAKPGAGASTIAINVAGALANEQQQNVLLIDGDFHSGVISLVLNVDPIQTVIDALESSHELNDSKWRHRTEKVHGFDLLPMPQIKSPSRFPSWNYHRLLNFVRTRYDTVILDMPEMLDAGNQAFINQAKTVYIVCTPESSSLFLAHRRIYELKSYGVERDRVDIILNRYLKKDQRLGQIEAMLGRQVSVILPYDSRHVRDATLGATLVDRGSPIGKAFSTFARTLTGAAPKGAARPAQEESLLSMFRKRAWQHS